MWSSKVRTVLQPVSRQRVEGGDEEEEDGASRAGGAEGDGATRRHSRAWRRSFLREKQLGESVQSRPFRHCLLCRIDLRMAPARLDLSIMTSMLLLLIVDMFPRPVIDCAGMNLRGEDFGLKDSV